MQLTLSMVWVCDWNKAYKLQTMWKSDEILEAKKQTTDYLIKKSLCGQVWFITSAFCSRQDAIMKWLE